MDPREFRALIRGKSDAEIYALAESAPNGLESLIDDVASSMAGAFDASAAAGQSAVIQYDITTPNGPHSFQLLVENGACTHTRDCDEKARLYLALSLPNFFRLVSGNISGQAAYFSGVLRVGGDVVFAMQLERLFKRPV